MNLNQIFKYKDGELYWKIRPRNNVNIGDPAGTLEPTGYKRVGLFGKHYRVHQLVWCMFNGEFAELIDHIDGDVSNNRIENLRIASYAGNAQNAKLRKDNTSGVKGVCWHKRDKCWRVQVQVNNNRFSANYDDLELAELVATEFRNKHHAEFVNHGRKPT